MACATLTISFSKRARRLDAANVWSEHACGVHTAPGEVAAQQSPEQTPRQYTRHSPRVKQPSQAYSQDLHFTDHISVDYGRASHRQLGGRVTLQKSCPGTVRCPARRSVERYIGDGRPGDGDLQVSIFANITKSCRASSPWTFYHTRRIRRT